MQGYNPAAYNSSPQDIEGQNGLGFNRQAQQNNFNQRMMPRMPDDSTNYQGGPVNYGNGITSEMINNN